MKYFSAFCNSRIRLLWRCWPDLYASEGEHDGAGRYRVAL